FRERVKIGLLFSSNCSGRASVLYPWPTATLPPGWMRTNERITPVPVGCVGTCWNRAPLTEPWAPTVLRSTIVAGTARSSRGSIPNWRDGTTAGAFRGPNKERTNSRIGGSSKDLNRESRPEGRKWAWLEDRAREGRGCDGRTGVAFTGDTEP